MNRRLTTIVLAVVLALLGTFGVLMYVRGADNRALAGKQAVSVLIAAKAIPAGTSASKLTSDGYLKIERLPAGSVPSDAIGSAKDLAEDAVIRDNVVAGTLIRRALLGAKGGPGAFTIPNGKIAVTVALGDPQRVAGHVQPGSKVVVFLSGSLIDAKGARKGEATIARTLLTDIEVLSVSVGGTDGNSASKSVTNLVTLAVTQREAEKLVFGSTGGGGSNGNGTALYLALQGDSSELNPNSPGVTSFSLFR